MQGHERIRKKQQTASKNILRDVTSIGPVLTALHTETTAVLGQSAQPVHTEHLSMATITLAPGGVKQSLCSLV